MATNPTISLREVSGWRDTINESVHTSDDQDIGDVEAANRDFIVVRRGYLNVHRYYIPVSKVLGWDGNVLWLSVPEEKVKASYERDVIPDPSAYYVKGEEDKYTGTHWKEFPRIEPRYTPPKYTVAPRGIGEEPAVFRCALCDAAFRTDEELSRHAAAH
ncbi:MAG: hypothetical protein M3275_01050 [Thermoproteota archaeon]|nr:hypothetical protein [Thermoproteota archaeon]